MESLPTAVTQEDLTVHKADFQSINSAKNEEIDLTITPMDPAEVSRYSFIGNGSWYQYA